MAGSEVAGLPEGGPATVDGVKDLLRITDTTDDGSIGDAVAAVNAAVRTWACAQDSVGEPLWNPRTLHGANLMAARLWRRRNSPSGVEAFTEQGPVYVSRNDPDVAMLLRLGSWSGPSVG